MKESQIPFKGPMVRAILDGTKTQTRRICKRDFGSLNPTQRIMQSRIDPAFRCPYGYSGDRLWVRETWRTCSSLDHVKPIDITKGAQVEYLADRWNDGFGPVPYSKGKTRPSIFMPRWASRITLEITGVRVERLQEITEDDALAEGCINDVKLEYDDDGKAVDYLGLYAHERFHELWDSLNGPGSWDANPWVWVIEFRRVSP